MRWSLWDEVWAFITNTEMVEVDWKLVHKLSYLLVLFFALEPSYIHPDEHFQSLEVLTSKSDLTHLNWLKVLKTDR